MVFAGHEIASLDELKEGIIVEEPPLQVCNEHEAMKIYCFDCKSVDHLGHSHEFITAPSYVNLLGGGGGEMLRTLILN